jgi:hypothetical protein
MLTSAENLFGFYSLDALPKGRTFNTEYCHDNSLTALLPVRPPVDGQELVTHANNCRLESVGLLQRKQTAGRWHS